MERLIQFTFILFLPVILQAQENKVRIEKHWINLTKIKNELVIFEPCDAENKQIYVDLQKGIMIMKYGQEEETYKILNISDSSKNLIKVKIRYETFGKPMETMVDIAQFDPDYGVWKWNFILSDGDNQLINEYIMVCESKSKLFKKVKQPCLECWPKEDCDKMNKEKK